MIHELYVWVFDVLKYYVHVDQWYVDVDVVNWDDCVKLYLDGAIDAADVEIEDGVKNVDGVDVDTDLDIEIDVVSDVDFSLDVEMHILGVDVHVNLDVDVHLDVVVRVIVDVVLG